MVVDHRYSIRDRIGSGSFADCYYGEDQKVGKLICLKIEDTYHCQTPKLHAEWDFLKRLDGATRRTPAPLQIISWQQARYTVLIQELLGPSLEDLFQRCGKRFSNQTVSLIAPQVLDCIEHCHRAGILHRDIKPHNFLVGRGNEAHRIFLIDFGLSRSYLDSEDRHIPFRKDRPLIGTSRYVSLAVHRGHEQGRRDDLESIAHMLYYFVWGQLPWQGLPKQPDKQKRHRMIFEAKERTGLDRLCDPHPPQLREFLVYARGLSFQEAPNYEFLRRTLKALQEQCAGGERYDQLDWRLNGVHTDGAACAGGDSPARIGGAGGDA